MKSHETREKGRVACVKGAPSTRANEQEMADSKSGVMMRMSRLVGSERGVELAAETPGGRKKRVRDV